MSQIFNKITGLGNDFKVIDKEQFENKEYIITNKDYINKEAISKLIEKIEKNELNLERNI